MVKSKQTNIINKYEFSIPMPFFKEHIDKVILINNEIEKSKITSLYFSLPANSTDFTGFEQERFISNKVTNFEYWKPLIEYSIKNNFDFIYVLNSPIIFYDHSENLQFKIENLNKLLNKLKKIGCNKIRVCNPQLMGYINKNYPYFEIYLSTSLEIKIIKDYINLFLQFKNIKNCVPSWDVNKNFRLLKNLTTKFPEIKIELMVNEGCFPACPFRVIHNSWTNIETDIEYKNFYFSRSFFKENCSAKMSNNLSYFFANTNIIYPWEIEEYKKIGITNFKLVGRNMPEFITGEYLNFYKYYLKGIDSTENIKNIQIKYFNNYICLDKNINYKVNEISHYLPNIKHFIKKGHLCASMCGLDCKYCHKCAEKIEKVFKKKQQEQHKRTIPFCIKSN